jgi:hypothetical protein
VCEEEDRIKRIKRSRRNCRKKVIESIESQRRGNTKRRRIFQKTKNISENGEEFFKKTSNWEKEQRNEIEIVKRRNNLLE